MPKIAIVMSTYNGREYIKEQIDSILNQSFTDFTLFIRDDGSTDSTLSFLQSMANTDSRVRLVVDNPGHANGNVGFGKSFSIAMSFAMRLDNFDYYAFCDQDDYWEEGKVATAVEALDACDKSKPALFSSNYYVCDEKLNPMDIFSNSNPMDDVTFENLFFEGVFPGFTMVINRTLAKLAFKNVDLSDIYYHDKWVTLIAIGLNGQIIYDGTALAKYRRHQAAASSTNLGVIAKLRWRVNKVLNGDFCPRTKQMLGTFKELFYKKVDEDIQHFLDVFTGKNRLKKLFFGKGLRRSKSGEFMLRMIILIGKI